MAQLRGQHVRHKVCVEEDALQPDAEHVEVLHQAGQAMENEIITGSRVMQNAREVKSKVGC